MILNISITGWPPSLNQYWRTFRGRNILSKAAREYRQNVLEQIKAARAAHKVPRNKITVPVVVDIELWPPDRRRRDLDNYQKGLFDALTKAGVWEDDSQVWDYRVHWGQGVVKYGQVVLKIATYQIF